MARLATGPRTYKTIVRLPQSNINLANVVLAGPAGMIALFAVFSAALNARGGDNGRSTQGIRSAGRWIRASA